MLSNRLESSRSLSAIDAIPILWNRVRPEDVKVSSDLASGLF